MIIAHTSKIKGKTKLQLNVKSVLISTTAGAAFFLSVAAFSQGDYLPSKTEYGQPDLQGVWNFASHTPLQRAEKYGDREYVTPEENEENRKQSIGSFEARAESHFDGVGGYNSFWYERAAIGDREKIGTLRTGFNQTWPIQALSKTSLFIEGHID